MTLGKRRRQRSSRRVLMIVENFPVPPDRRVWQEACALRDAGYEVTVISPRTTDYPRRIEVRDGITILRHPRVIEASRTIQYFVEYANAIVWETMLALRASLSPGFETLHIANPPDASFILGALFRLFGKKVVFDQHDLSPEVYAAKFDRRGMLWRLLLASEAACYRTADAVIVTNESIREIAEVRGKCPSDRVFVVRNGPDLERITVVPPVEALKSGRRYLVGYVGVMGRQEGIDGLLRIVKHIVDDQQRHDVHFMLVGGGTELAELERYAEELDVSDYVTFAGYLSGRPLLEALNTANVCVTPDIANEMNDRSTMVKTMEYMALGKPVVQYETIEGRRSAGEAALYAARNNEADFAKKLLYLLDNPEERRRLGEVGRKRVHEELAWKHQIPQLIKAYESLDGGTDG